MAGLRTRFFHAWFRFNRPMTLGVRAAVENAAGEVCMVRHTYVKGWYFPGGGVERDEPALEALTRELEEEAGVRLTGEAVLVGVYSNHYVFRNDHVLLYRVPHGAWEPVRATSVGEIAETAWVQPAAPLPGTTAASLARLNELYAGAPRSPYWAPPTS